MTASRAQNFVRHETAIAKSPQKIVQRSHALVVCGPDMDFVIQSICFFGEAADELPACRFAARAQNVKVDLGHG